MPRKEKEKEHSSSTRGLGRNGSRASMACINCRQRKIKCDVQHKAPGMRCTKCQNAQISCAIEPGGDRRRCRVENTSESLSLLRGRMQVLEDMLLKEHGVQVQNRSTTTQENHDARSQDAPDASESPSNPHTADGTSDPTTSSVSVDAATTVLDLHPIDTMPMSISDRQSDCEVQAPSYSYDTMPIDDLDTLPTPLSPSLMSNNETNNDYNNDINKNSDKTDNSTNAINNSSNPRPHDVFEIGPYHCPENHVPHARMHLAPPNTGTVPQIDHMSMTMQLDNLHQHQHTNDVSNIHEKPIEAVDQSRVRARGAMTPSNEDIDSATDTDPGRFYGPTSQPYLQSAHEESPISTTDELGTDMSLDIDSTQVRRLLFQSYWAIHGLAAKVIVDKESFMADRSIGKRSQYYSTFLENALLACATRTSTSSSMRELGQRFLQRARAEVLNELEHLNIASMQGFLLLSDYEATRGRDRLGWMYCGIACRSLYDLGLHENIKENQLEPANVVSRHSVFLASFVYDQLWSLYLGRPSSISLGYVRTARLAAKNVTVPEELDAWVSLCVQIAKVTETLNASPWADVKAYDRRLSELSIELDACFENLPIRLRYEEGNALDLDASAYGLNIQHCGLQIVLHRNSIRLRQERRNELESSDSSHNVEYESSQRQAQSARIVHQSAIRIAKLIRTYKQIYGVEKIITIMLDNMYVAATALIWHILLPANTAGTDKDIQWLRSLSATLEDVQNYYPITTVMISTLSRLVEGTTLSKVFRVRRSESTEGKESPMGGLTAVPPLSEAGWGSREAFMNGFSFDMGTLMDTNFRVDDDQNQYFQNPVLGPSPPWGVGFPTVLRS